MSRHKKLQMQKTSLLMGQQPGLLQQMLDVAVADAVQRERQRWMAILADMSEIQKQIDVAINGWISALEYVYHAALWARGEDFERAMRRTGPSEPSPSEVIAAAAARLNEMAIQGGIDATDEQYPVTAMTADILEAIARRDREAILLVYGRQNNTLQGEIRAALTRNLGGAPRMEWRHELGRMIYELDQERPRLKYWQMADRIQAELGSRDDLTEVEEQILRELAQRKQEAAVLGERRWKDIIGDLFGKCLKGYTPQ